MLKGEISSRPIPLAERRKSGLSVKLMLSIVVAAGSMVAIPGQAQEPPEDCAPHANGNGNGRAERDRSLTEKLDRCNGELKAPGVGDNEMVEPAPETGNMPVIKPKSVPPDENPQND